MAGWPLAMSIIRLLWNCCGTAAGENVPYLASVLFGHDEPGAAGALLNAIYIASQPGEHPMVSRRELIKAIGAGVAALPTITDATALAQGTVSPPTDAAPASGVGSAG